MNPVRIVIADDQALLRGTFRLLLDSEPDLEVVAEAGTGAEAVDAARRTSPDVVLMDIRMPDVDGIEATRRICADPSLANTRILVLTTFETDEFVLAAIRAGASGFVGKGIAPADLVAAVRTVAAGEQLLSPAATRAVLAQLVDSTPPPPRGPLPGTDPLTERELQITAMVARGLSNTEIADELVISPATAKTHVNRAMTKTGARDRAQLVVFAYEAGLAQP